MVGRASGCVLILLVLSEFPVARSSSHWVVTEDGRIQAQPDSLFHMRRPYDLVALLRQEERATLVESLRRELLSQKTDIEQHEDKESDLEQHLYSTDGDCVAAGKPLTELDLHISTILLFESRGIKVDPFEDSSAALGKELQKPVCTTVIELEFSMQSFEHLLAMQLRSNLTIAPEVGLLSALAKSDNVDVFGHHVHDGLTKNQTSWVHFNMAVYYWRMVGDAYNAMECVRRALHFSPSEYKDIALVNLANILHRAQYSEEASIVAYNAVKNYPTNAVSLFTLGNIYTVLTDYSKAVVCYRNALKLQPDFEMASRHLRAVLCHRKLEQALEAQHSSLQKTLVELREYQQQHEDWLRHQEKLMTEQAPLEVRRESRLQYEEHKLRRNSNGRGRECVQYHQDGHTFLSCSLKREPKSGTEAKVDLSLDMQLLQAVETQAERLEEAVAKQKKPKRQNDDPTDDASDHLEPSQPPRFPRQPASSGDTSAVVDNLGPDWPSQEECNMTPRGIPNANEFPSVFLPPENKGFEVTKFLGEHQGLSAEEEHPLPWYPPLCGQKEGTNDPASQFMPGTKGKDQYPKLPDPSLKPFLLSYIDGDQSTEEEVGQRILTALKKSIGPSWLLYNMAALYWRVLGNIHNAIDCLRRSLRAVTPEYADVPFVNYASLLHKMGLPDEALVLALKAFAFNDYEPETNFLLGNLWTLKKNWTGAILHYKRVLQQNPGYPDAMQFLSRVSCHRKFLSSQEETTSTTPVPPGSMCPSLDLDTVVCTQNHCPTPGVENCLTTVRCFTHSEWAEETVTKGCALSNPQMVLARQLENVLKSPEHMSDSDEESEFIAISETVMSDLDDEDATPLASFTDESLQMSLSDYSESPPPSSEMSKKVHVKLDVGTFARSTTVVTTEPDGGVTRNQPVADDPLPDVTAVARVRLRVMPPSLSDCQGLHFVNLRHFTSTWLSVSAKNVHINDYVNMLQLPVTGSIEEPLCDSSFPSSAHTLDHLAGVKHRQRLVYSAETGLKEAFQTLGREGEEPAPIPQVATGIAHALQKNSTSWVITTLAALYWRISGNANEAITCLRQALHYAPRAMKDIPLISLANIFHRAALFNDALIVANMALEISPRFVVIHFTLANIYAAKGDLDKAVAFYESTLALQSTFEPARDRLRSVHCGALFLQRERLMGSLSRTSP